MTLGDLRKLTAHVRRNVETRTRIAAINGIAVYRLCAENHDLLPLEVWFRCADRRSTVEDAPLILAALVIVAKRRGIHARS